MQALHSNIAEIELRYQPKLQSEQCIDAPEKAHALLLPYFPADTIALQEQFVVAFLNRANQPLGIYQASKGGMTGTVVDIRLMISTALKIAAVSFIVAHNHPSGQLKASRQDMELTEKIQKAGALLDIQLLDHLILVASGDFYSFTQDQIFYHPSTH